jgi:hypothetical protein
MCVICELWSLVQYRGTAVCCRLVWRLAYPSMSVNNTSQAGSCCGQLACASTITRNAPPTRCLQYDSYLCRGTNDCALNFIQPFLYHPETPLLILYNHFYIIQRFRYSTEIVVLKELASWLAWMGKLSFYAFLGPAGLGLDAHWLDVSISLVPDGIFPIQLGVKLLNF